MQFRAPFLGRERSPSEAAGELGRTLDAVPARVRRLERLGRASKDHQAVADESFVPVTPELLEKHLLRSETFWHGALLGQLEHVLVEVVRRSGEPPRPARGGDRAGRGPVPAPNLTEAPWPAVAFEWTRLELGDDAKTLQRALQTVLLRSAGKQRPGAPAFTVATPMAPGSPTAGP